MTNLHDRRNAGRASSLLLVLVIGILALLMFVGLALFAAHLREQARTNNPAPVETTPQTQAETPTDDASKPQPRPEISQQ